MAANGRTPIRVTEGRAWHRPKEDLPHGEGELCTAANVVCRLQFPKPTGGGSVIVHDPFIFDAK